MRYKISTVRESKHNGCNIFHLSFHFERSYLFALIICRSAIYIMLICERAGHGDGCVSDNLFSLVRIREKGVESGIRLGL